MTEQEIKIECLRLTGGVLSEAKELFAWVGIEAPAEAKTVLPQNARMAQSLNPFNHG